MYQTKHIYSDGGHTPIAVESSFWSAIDLLTREQNLTWEQCVQQALGKKPSADNRSSRIRCQAINHKVSKRAAA